MDTNSNSNASASERDRIIKRLRKVLSLTTSSNAGEAAAAMKQAATLMAKYGLDEIDAHASAIKESGTTLSGSELPGWERALISVIRDALGVEAITKTHRKEHGWRRPNAQIIFLGEGHLAEIARYAYEVLRKRLRNETRAAVKRVVQDAFPGEDTSRFKVKVTKREREAYAVGWCRSAQASIKNLAPTPESPAMTRYLQLRGVKEPPKDKPKERLAAKKNKDLSKLAMRLLVDGHIDGKKVRLHQGVNVADNLKNQLALDLQRDS